MDALEFYQTVAMQELEQLCTDPEYIEWSERIEDECTDD
jgi:hypothetical protein